MSTVDRDKSTMVALHELRAIEQRCIAEEAAAEQARREAEEREAEAQRAREQAEREARERTEREENERLERERDERQAKAARVARLEDELAELSQRMSELREGLRPASEPLTVPAAAPASRHWAWGFAAVSWLGAFTLIAILWHVAQRPPVVPRFVVPDIDATLSGLPGAGRADPPETPGPTTTPKDRAEGGPRDSTRNAPVSAQAGPRRGSPLSHPRGAARNDTRSVATKVSLEACAHSDDPLACVNLDDHPLGREPRPKPKTR